MVTIDELLRVRILGGVVRSRNIAREKKKKKRKRAAERREEGRIAPNLTYARTVDISVKRDW